MMDLDDVMEQLEEAEAMLLEPRAVFDAALAGIVSRADGMQVAAYDSGKCIDALMAAHDWDFDEALEWFEVNTSGAWVGAGTPVFIDLIARDAA